MTRALVIAPQWIGDAVMSQPLLGRLAARGEQLTVAALPWVAPVVRAMPERPAVIELPLAHGRLDLSQRRRLAAEWRGRFDVAYVLPNSIKSALIPAFARIPRRVGYQGEGRFGVLNERLANPKQERPPMVAHYAALAGPGADAHARPRLVVEREAEAAALRAAGLEAQGFHAFAPGAEYGPAKRWPAERYAELAARLHARDGLAVALLGSMQEAVLCEEIAAAAPGCVVLAGHTSLDAAIALIGAARSLVSNDSGLMHVGAALGVPQVAIFGSTSPLHTPPHNPRAQVLWLKDELKLDCMPCFERTCRYGHYGCLTSVTVERVERALDHGLQDVSLPTR
jgi:heptosyltransferase-2